MFDNLQPFDHYKPIAGVYAIVCKALQRCYIGESNHIHSRLAAHANDLHKGKHSSARLQADHDAGHEITYSILQVESNRKKRLKLEQALIHSIIAGGYEVYNIQIVGKSNYKERAARNRRGVLQGNIGRRGQINGRGTSGIASHAENAGYVRKGWLNAERQQGAGVEGGQSKLHQPEVTEGVGGVLTIGKPTQTKRPAYTGVGTHRQRRQSGQRAAKALSRIKKPGDMADSIKQVRHGNESERAAAVRKALDDFEDGLNLQP